MCSDDGASTGCSGKCDPHYDCDCHSGVCGCYETNPGCSEECHEHSDCTCNSGVCSTHGCNEKCHTHEDYMCSVVCDADINGCDKECTEVTPGDCRDCPEFTYCSFDTNPDTNPDTMICSLHCITVCSCNG